MHMRLKKRLYYRLQELLRVHILRRSAHGHIEYVDIDRSGSRIETVFDVGANVGNMSMRYADVFPQAEIYAFEPVSSTFQILKRNVGSLPKVQCYQLALGSREGEQAIYLTDQDETNSLVKPEDPRGQENVSVRTVDQIVEEHGLNHIDLLKIDVEGFDLEVLRGAESCFSRGMVSFVFIEVGFQPGDRRQVLFDDMARHLRQFGFATFGIYTQRLEWSGEQRLRFGNACFANEDAFRN
jgi:FkbM family methyltransferase